LNLLRKKIINNELILQSELDLFVDLSSLFKDIFNYDHDISNWDVSHVTNMSSMFENFKSFNQDLSLWDVSSVENMSSMFKNCIEFNSNINSWDVRFVSNFSYMFSETKKFNSPLSNWKLESVESIEGIFSLSYYNSNLVPFLTQVQRFDINSDDFCYESKYLKLKDIKRSLILFYFPETSSLNFTVSDINIFSSSTNVFIRSNNQTLLLKNSLSNYDINLFSSLVSSFASEDDYFFYFDFIVKSIDSLKVKIQEQRLVSIYPFLSDIDFIPLSSSIDIDSNIIVFAFGKTCLIKKSSNFSRDQFDLFHSFDFLPDFIGEDDNFFFFKHYKIISTNNSSLSDLNIINSRFSLSNISDHLYNVDCSNSPKFLSFKNIIDFKDVIRHKLRNNEFISKKLLSHVSDLSFLFFDIDSYTKDISNWDVSHVTNMNSMFKYCSSFNQNISNWDVSNVSNMSCMFESCISFNQDISNWDISSLSNSKHILSGTSSFNFDMRKWIPKGSFDKLTFKLLSRNINLDKRNLLRTKVMRNEFISNSDLSGVTSLKGLFQHVDLYDHSISHWDVSNIKNMKRMFKGVRFDISDISNWNLSSLLNCEEMFQNMHTCSFDSSSFENTLFHNDLFDNCLCPLHLSGSSNE
jgi:surface protein